jgi:hypothetical protein
MRWLPWRRKQITQDKEAIAEALAAYTEATRGKKEAEQLSREATVARKMFIKEFGAALSQKRSQ